MLVQEFLQKNKIPFLFSQKTTEKKQIGGLVEGYNKMSYKELMQHNRSLFDDDSYNTLLFKVPNNMLIVDTDTEDGYKFIKKYLSTHNLYNEKCVTKSFSGVTKKLKYKLHFYFTVENIDEFKHVKKSINTKTGIDIFYNCWGVCEFPSLEIDINFPKPAYMDYKNIYNFSKSKKQIDNNSEISTADTEEKHDNNINVDIDTNNSNVDIDTDDEIFNICKHLNKKRFNDFEDWFKIYCTFINEGYDLNIFETLSKTSKKYNKENNKKILSSIKPQLNGYNKRTLLNLLKDDDIDFYNKSMELDPLKIATDMTQNILAKFYYNLNPNKYVKSDKTGWYEFKKNNILQPKGNNPPISLLNDFSDRVQSIFQSEINKRLTLAKRNDDKDLMNEVNIFLKAFKTIGNSKFVKGCIEYLNVFYTIERLDDLVDNNNNLIAFDDGKCFDISNKQFRKILPTDYITKTCKRNSCDIINDEKIKEVKDLLISIFDTDEMVDYWLSVVGSSLFTNKFESFYILTGRGGNGKGLLFELLKNCIGEYYYQTENTFLTSIKNGGPNPTLASCKGVRILAASEPDDGSDKCKLGVDFIKSMTGGDSITCRPLYGQNMTYKPQFNVFLQCNDIPVLGKIDGGIQRRLKIVKYENQFVNNPINDNEKLIDSSLKSKVSNDIEFQNAFLSLLIEYACIAIDKNEIVSPNKVNLVTDDYINENNPVKSFLYDYFEFTHKKEDRIKVSEYSKLFNEHNNDNRLSPMRINSDMKKLNFVEHKIQGNRYWIGIKRKHIEEDSDYENPEI